MHDRRVGWRPFFVPSLLCVHLSSDNPITLFPFEPRHGDFKSDRRVPTCDHYYCYRPRLRTDDRDNVQRSAVRSLAGAHVMHHHHLLADVGHISRGFPFSSARGTRCTTSGYCLRANRAPCEVGKEWAGLFYMSGLPLFDNIYAPQAESVSASLVIGCR